MMDFDEEPIDRAEQALKLLVEQYRGSERIQGLIRAVANQLTEVDEARVQAWTKRWLDTAEGKQLDGLGEILGATRQGRNDDEYRLRLQAQVTINAGSGTPEDVISGVSFLTGANQVWYQEDYPASVRIFVDEAITESQAQRMRRLMPAGVGSLFVLTTDGDAPFGVTGIDESPYPDALGFGELGMHALEFEDGTVLELEDGTALGMIDQNDPILPTEGGALAELIEA